MLPQPDGDKDKTPQLDECETPEAYLQYLKWLVQNRENWDKLEKDDMMEFMEVLSGALSEREAEVAEPEDVKPFLDEIIGSFSDRVIGILNLRGRKELAESLVRGKVWGFAQLHKVGIHAYKKPETHDVMSTEELLAHVKTNLKEEFMHGHTWVSQVYYITGIKRRDSLSSQDIANLREIGGILENATFDRPSSALSPLKCVLAIQVVCDLLEELAPVSTEPKVSIES